MRNLYHKTKKANQETNEKEFRWLSGVIGIVADNEDPEAEHRIRVLIPSINKSKIYDEWARALIPCMGHGYGCVFIPPVNSEVVLFGQLGQKFNLFYMGVYNETHKLPPEFIREDGIQDQTVSGFHVEGDFKIISELDLHQNAKRIRIVSGSTIQITAPGGVFINNKPVS